MDCPSTLNKNFWETVHSYPKAEISKKKKKKNSETKISNLLFYIFLLDKPSSPYLTKKNSSHTKYKNF